MNITIYTVTYNEQVIIPLFIKHYRERFPDCHIVIYDNQSTDRTVEIAKAAGCEIRFYDSMGLVDDQKLWDCKNSCWRNAKTEWALVCDTDELLDITAEELQEEHNDGVTKIKCEAYHMVNHFDNHDVEAITHGYRDPHDTVYDKDLLFNKRQININYINNDCHFTQSTGNVKDSVKRYKMYHYKYVNENSFVAKQQESACRLSNLNRKNNWGYQCLRDEQAFRNEFRRAKEGSIKLVDRSAMKHFYHKIQNWFDYQSTYTQMVDTFGNGAHFVEVGAWKGASSAYMCVEIINSKKKIKFDVVDIWTGDLKDSNAFTTDQEFMNYNKNIFPLFMKNLEPIFGKLDFTPRQLPSTEAAKLYADDSLDFVFIDANHDYEYVKTDIEAWLPKIRSGGYIGGHDYSISFPGVVQAVTEQFGNVPVVGSTWLVKVY